MKIKMERKERIETSQEIEILEMKALIKQRKLKQVWWI